MRLLFCADPLRPRLPDSAYAAETAVAERLGIEYSLVSFEALAPEGDAARAVRRVAPAPEGGEMGLYRGWMMTPEQYADLYDKLCDRRVTLVNTPEQYTHCHYLPHWYGQLKGQTPRSVWARADADISLPRLMTLLRDFGSSPVIVKDYVKSRKHEWREACYIPSAADAEAVDRVTRRFLELQGTDLNAGLVLREFVEFEPTGSHQKSGMPLTREFRLFFLDGKIVQMSQYWDQGDYAGETPPLDHFTSLASSTESRFFTMDVARTRAGGWLVMELGDAQVAELPEQASPDVFFQHLQSALS